MLKTTSKIVLTGLIALGLLCPAMTPKAEAAKGKKKVGFFKRVTRKVKRTVKRVAKKTKRAVVKTGAAIQNKVMDSAVKAKSCITGKKAKKTFVKGHYKKGQKTLTNGHFRRVKRNKKPAQSGGGVIPAPAPSAPMDPALPQ